MRIPNRLAFFDPQRVYEHQDHDATYRNKDKLLRGERQAVIASREDAAEAPESLFRRREFKELFLISFVIHNAAFATDTYYNTEAPGEALFMFSLNSLLEIWIDGLR